MNAGFPTRRTPLSDTGRADHGRRGQIIPLARATLTRGGQEARQRAAGLIAHRLAPARIARPAGPSPNGIYADFASVLNGADHLEPTRPVNGAFADNLYPGDNPSHALAGVPADRPRSSCGPTTQTT